MLERFMTNIGRKIRHLSTAIAAVVALFAVQADAAVKLPSVFTDHMVLQQQKKPFAFGAGRMWAKPCR